MPAPLYCCSPELTERKGSVVLLKGTCLRGISTRRTVKVRILKSWLLQYFPKLFAGVGVVPRAKSDEIPDIMEIQKAELSEDQDCFYNDPDINQMRIQVRSQVWLLGAWPNILI